METSTRYETTSTNTADSGSGFTGLLIDTFDQWADSTEIALYPSNICWCRTDVTDQGEPTP
jgi:hypothetical protein